MRTSVKVTGLREVVAAFEKTERKAVNKDAHKSAAKLVEDEARDRVPVVSSDLERSIRSSGTQTSGVVRAGKAAVPYAGPVHFGAANRPQGGFTLPNPFLFDARDARKGEVYERFEDYLEKAIVANGLR